MEIIDIASFNFDDDKIIQQLDDLNEKIRQNKLEIEKTRERTVSLNSTYKKLGQELEKLERINQKDSDAYKEKTITRARYLNEMTKEKMLISEINQENNLYRKEISGLNRLLDDQTKVQAVLNQGYEKEALNIENIRALRASVINVRNKEIAQDGEQSEKGKSLNKVIEDLTNLEKSLVAETEQRFYTIGDYAGQLEGNFNSLSSVINKINNNEAVKTADVKKAKEDLLKVRQQEIDKITKTKSATEDEIKTRIKESSAIKEIDKSLNLLNQREKFGNLRTELKDITSALAGMRIEGQKNTKQYEELSKRAYEVRKALNIVNQEVSKASSTTKHLDTLVGSATALTSIFSVAQGATQLFGENNKDLQESILKVTSVISILNGLQQIQIELKKKDTIITQAQSAAQKVYALAIGSSTGALKVFKIALASTGIGAIILLIGSLIANWDKVTSTIKESFPALEGFGDKLDKMKAYVMGFLNAYLSLFNTIFTTIKKIINLDLSGAINELKNTGLNAKKAFLAGRQSSLEDTARRKADEQLQKQIEQDARDTEVIEARTGKKQYERRAKNIKDQLKLTKEGSDEEVKLKQDLRVLLAEEERKR